MRLFHILTIAAAGTSTAFVAGCATAPPPPLTAASPASPDAPEGARLARTTSLRPDALSRKSHTLLAAAQKEQEKWDDYGPVSGTPEDAAKDPPQDGKKMEMKHGGMNHEGH